MKTITQVKLRLSSQDLQNIANPDVRVGGVVYDPSQNDTTEEICAKQRFSIVIKAAIGACKQAFVSNPEALQPTPLQLYASIERMPEVTSEVAKLDEETCAFIKSIIIRAGSESSGNLLQLFRSVYKLKELAKIRGQISDSF